MNLARVRRVNDKLLERNQAARLALLDLQHVITLLDWLHSLAETRGDAEWAAWHKRWATRLRREEKAARAELVALAADPDAAIEPAVPTVAGRVGHKAALALGTLGEAIDARAAKKR